MILILSGEASLGINYMKNTTRPKSTVEATLLAASGMATSAEYMVLHIWWLLGAMGIMCSHLACSTKSMSTHRQVSSSNSHVIVASWYTNASVESAVGSGRVGGGTSTSLLPHTSASTSWSVCQLERAWRLASIGDALRQSLCQCRDWLVAWAMLGFGDENSCRLGNCVVIPQRKLLWLCMPVPMSGMPRLAQKTGWVSSDICRLPEILVDVGKHKSHIPTTVPWPCCRFCQVFAAVDGKVFGKWAVFATVLKRYLNGS